MGHVFMNNRGGGSSKNYIKNGLVAFFDGRDAPVGGKWIDKVQGLEATLNSVTYDSVNKRYNFPQGAYAPLPANITVGQNYTVELVLGTQHQALNEQGGIIEDLGQGQWLYTLNNNRIDVQGSGYIAPAYSNNAPRQIAISKMQNAQHRAYVAGREVVLTSASSANTNRLFGVIGSMNSGRRRPLQIHAIRIYNRELTSEELVKNAIADMNNY